MRICFNDAKGETHILPIDQVSLPTIKRSNVPERYSKRIREVYSQISDVMKSNFVPLERFEAGFLHDLNIEKEMKIWERIGAAYQRAIPLFGNAGTEVFNRLVTVSLGGMSSDDLNKDENYLLFHLYYNDEISHDVISRINKGIDKQAHLE